LVAYFRSLPKSDKEKDGSSNNKEKKQHFSVPEKFQPFSSQKTQSKRKRIYIFLSHPSQKYGFFFVFAFVLRFQKTKICFFFTVFGQI
jgi:hypothetical protein